MFCKKINLMNVNFSSDNYAPAHPKIIEAIEKANEDCTIAYGEDKHTKKAQELLEEIFGKGIKSFFVFNGTAANALSLKQHCRSYESIICPITAHIEVNECGAVENFAGTKL